MYRIEKRFTIATGHRLSKHLGLCKNFHGHNLTILVGVKSESLNRNDMIIDFSILKDMVKKHLEKFDHCLLLNKSDDMLADILENQYNFKIELFDFDPTAERLSEYIYNQLKPELFDMLGIHLEYVTIYENENSKATFSEE